MLITLYCHLFTLVCLSYQIVSCWNTDCELVIFVAQSLHSAWYLGGTPYVFVG